MKSVLIVNSEIYSAIINKLLYWKKIFVFLQITLEKRKIQQCIFSWCWYSYYKSIWTENPFHLFRGIKGQINQICSYNLKNWERVSITKLLGITFELMIETNNVQLWFMNGVNNTQNSNLEWMRIVLIDRIEWFLRFCTSDNAIFPIIKVHH